MNLAPEPQLRGFVSLESPASSWWSIVLISLWSFVLPVLECSAVVSCSAADSHLTQLTLLTELSGVLFIVCQCVGVDLAHWRSVALLFMQFKIKSNIMYSQTVHSLFRLVLHVGCSWAFVYASNHPRICMERVSATSCTLMWDLWVVRAEPIRFYWVSLIYFCLSLLYRFLLSLDWMCGVGPCGLITCFHSLPALLSWLLIIIIIIKWARDHIANVPWGRDHTAHIYVATAHIHPRTEH